MIEEPSLVSGGDCRAHWHSEDRVPTQDFLHGLQGVAKNRPITSNTTLTGEEDFVSVDTRTGNVTVTLPRAINYTEVEVMKLYPQYTLIVLPQGSDTILQTTGVTYAAANAAIRFKAIGTDWRVI